MAKSLKIIQGTSSMGGKLALGAVVSMVVTFIGAAICAAMVSSEMISEGSMGYCAMVILFLSAVAGAVAATMKVQEKRLYISIITGLVYTLILLAITALFFDGQYQGIGVTLIVVLSGCILVVLLDQSRGKGVKSRRSKIRRR